MPSILNMLIAALAATVIVAAWQWRRARRRRLAYARVLDAADAFEARLRLARAQIDSLDVEVQADPVRAALQEMLRQRLWLQRHGQGASVDVLEALGDSIVTAQQQIDRQLAQLAQARAAAGI